MISLDTMQIIQFIIKAAKIIIPLIAFLTVFFINWSNAFEREEVNAYERTEKEKESFLFKYFDYNAIDDRLTKIGIYYSFPDLTPASWMTIKVACGVLLMLIGISLVNIILGLVLMIIGFFVPDIIANIQNASDNDAMLGDIKNIFDTLKIQTKAGVFLSYSLCECYLIVETPRLKAELLNMTNKIISTNNIEKSIEEFNSKFDNQYIDTLCITILQSMESGKSAQVLEDLSKQISDMQGAINIKIQEALDRKIQMMQMGLFLAMIIVCIYVLGTSVIASLGSF